MRIENLELINFKNFTHLNVTFREGVNLFVGANGSGKTSLLEGICVAIGAFFGSQEQKMQRGIAYDEIKITNGRREGETTVKATDRFFVKDDWSRTIKRNTKTNDSKKLKPISEYGAKFFEVFENQEDRTIAPIIAFYSTQRLFKDAHQSKKQLYDAKMGRRNGYLQCLEEKAIKPLLTEWLKGAVTRRATFQIKDIDNVDNVLENVELALKEALIFFADLPVNFSLKIYSEPEDDNELYILFEDQPPLPLSYYSDGYRNLLFLIIDLVWRASQLNPWLTLQELKSQLNGVVLIDEIDLHLHPRWQGKAIVWIQNLFPFVQFFITTHSPTVVANFENGNLYIIEKEEVKLCNEKYFGKEVNSILRNILGAPDRHIDTQNKLDRLFQLIDDEASVLEINPLLEELIHLLGQTDSEIQKAKSLIEWNNYKQENAIH